MDDDLGRIRHYQPCGFGIYQRMLDVVQPFACAGSGVTAEHTLGEPRPIEQSVGQQRVRAEHGGDPWQRRSQGATISCASPS